MNWKTIALFALSLFIIQVSFAQEKQKKILISGYVTDGNDNPLQGVSIIVDGVTLNKVTNTKGFYRVKVNPDIKTFMVFSLLHGGLEVEFTGKSKIDFILAPNLSGSGKFLSKEELVDIGYGNAKKNSLAYSVGEIDNNKSTPKYRTIFEMIQGQIPGVIVNGSSIIIRGVASVKGDSQPLFIVDGISTSSVDMVNPGDVKKIDVLKGSSAAIYGTRGSNGVILITTFRGKVRY